MNKEPLREQFDRLAQKARLDGVSLEMMIMGSDSLSLSYQKGELETFESESSQVAGIRLVDGPATAVVSTENLSAEALDRAYKQAYENLRLVQQTLTGDAIPLASMAPLSDDMRDLEEAEEISIEQQKEMARNLEGLVLKADPRIQSVPYSGYTEGRSWVRLMNSRGLDRFHRQKSHSGYAYALAKEGDVSKMDGESFFSRRFDQIRLQDLTRKAALGALSRLPAKKMKTGRMPVLFDRDIAGTLIAMFSRYLSAKAIKENKSLFAGKLGEQIAMTGLTLIDDPFDRRGSGCRPFDSEGCVSKKTVLIENGILRSFMTNLELSQMLKLPHTAHAARSPSSEMDTAPSNLILSPGAHSREQMLSAAPQVLLLTEINGGLHAGFKSATGDFSLPAEGVLYEKGAPVGPVDQFVVSGNILELLKGITALGNELCEPRGSVLVPDVLVGELSLAGAS